MSEFLQGWDWLSLAYWGIDPVHATIEGIFVVFIIYLLLQKSYKIPHHPEALTESEKDQLVREWTPEPLVPPMSKHQRWSDKRNHTIKSAPSTVVITSDDSKALNFATTNFLGMSDSKEIKAVAEAAIKHYGVGSCGPRGFYGTMDKHLEMESTLAKFMRTEEALIYSAGFTTVASAIPAFAKVFDLVLCDAGVSHSLQTGAMLSRSKTVFWKHNDIADLRRILEEIRANETATKKSYRKFVIIEGLYQNYGDIVPLPEIMELKYEFSLRIIMDDTYGVGTLGKTGRGTCEHYGINPMDLDVLTSSLSHAFGTIGGFCAGRRSVVFHQRLNASGYVFSASSPPYLVAAGVAAINKLDNDSDELLSTLRSRITLLHRELQGIEKHGLTVRGTCKESPLVHVEIIPEVFEAKIKSYQAKKSSRHNNKKHSPHDDDDKAEKEKQKQKERELHALSDSSSNSSSSSSNNSKDKRKNDNTWRKRKLRIPEKPMTPAELAHHRGSVLIQKIVDRALEKGVLVIRATYADTEQNMPKPSIRLTVCVNHSDEQIRTLAHVLKGAASDVLLK
eukprot:TRINITY_DN1579_c2_g1_i1.p1 TRINITY_DN1579_c2_g1~~TRINITY_DN1579_c2_g1_i1.p1  ORF type:complete len:563 (-),score=112.87 TRINITY_DN1579_c2_g1_i1:278-1966(-)